MQAVFLDKYPLDQGDVNLRALRNLVPDLHLYDDTAPAEIAERIHEADIVILNKVTLGDERIREASRLKLIVLCATGTDNVDVAAAGRCGITVCNCRGYATPAVVQHTVGLLLALHTRLIDYDRAVRDRRWERGRRFCLLDYPIRELAGRTLGILGHGDLGRNVAHVARALGMQVLIAERPGRKDPRPGRTPLPEVLEACDALSLHCPLTPETRHVIGREALARMRDDAFLVNTARGGLVDEQALADALKDGRLGGAGVDVLSVEPPRDGNPLLDPAVPNLIVTPHSAWGSHEARQRALDQVVENIQGFVDGKPVRVVSG